MSVVTTPDASSRQKENQKSKIRDAKRLGGPRIPLSPSKPSPAPSCVDDLAHGLDNLSISQPVKSKAHPLAAPPTNAPLASLNIGEDSDASKTFKFAPSEHNKTRTYKPIDDYRSPIQLLTRDPNWAALAPQAQHGMLGIGNMPLNLTSVVKNDWQGRKTQVSEATMSQARELSKSIEIPKPRTENPDDEGPMHQKIIVNHGAVSTTDSKTNVRL